MSYGLYDGDLKLYPRVPFFNLELMKLSSYYKNKREIVAFSPEFKPNMYTHFLVRQDFPTNVIYPYHSNIEYGGRAFDGSKYKPLPLPIERSRADITIYDKIKIPYKDKNPVKVALSTMRRAEHVRLSLDGKTIWPDWEKQLRHDKNVHGIMFHDYSLGDIDGAYELIRDNLNDLISKPQGRRIGMKFPLVLDNEEDFIKWFSIPTTGFYFYLHYNGILTTNIIEPLKSCYVLSKLAQVTVNPTKNITYEEFINSGIQSLFKNMLDLRRARIVFSLVYDKGFFADSQWAEVMDLITIFNSHIVKEANKNYFDRKIKYETLYSYMKQRVDIDKINNRKPIFRDKVINAFQFLRENNYELFKMFYEYTGEEK